MINGRTRLLLASLFLASVSSGCLSTKQPGDIFSSQDGAEPDASSKLELPPHKAAQACQAAAQMMEQQGKYREAAFEYEKARSNDPSLGKIICRRLAVVYDRAGEFDKARAEYEKAMALHPKDADLLNDAGYSRYCGGDWTSAESLLRRSIQIKPDNNKAWINLGMTLVQESRAAEALEAFTHAVPEPEAHCNMAFAYSLQGKRREAMQEYRRALELAPDLDLARGALAKLENPNSGRVPPAKAESGSFASQRAE